MKFRIFSLVYLFTIFSFSQEFDMNLVKNMKPRNIGPGGMSGRVTAVDVVLSNPDIIYAGTASGGLWKSTSGGVNWKPIFDNEVTSSIGAVAIQQSNPDVIWVGTGEGNPRNSLNGGYGIYKSNDGGNTWKVMGLEKTRHIHRVIIDPTNPDVVYVGAIGSPWGEHTERGVFKTIDGGKSWKKILYENKKTGIADLVMDPKNPNKLIAAMWEHKRDPWFFNSGGKGSGIHVTHDGGENWKKLSAEEGLPKGDLGRIGLAIASNKTNIIYALIEAKKNGLYKSEDGGLSWKMINDNLNEIGNRPFYYADLYVDPENENRLFSIFTYVNKSEDGGKSFKQLMPAYGVSNGIHPDHHAWWIHPSNGNFMIDGNDGGLNITKDGGENWRFVGNLPVAQFYHINIDNEIPYNVYGGMQDNGSWRGPAYVWRDQGIRNSYWQEISFGDGFDVIPDPENSRYGWSMSQEGYVNRYDWITGNNYTVRPIQKDPNIKLRFNWNSAINIDPNNSNTIFFGSQFVHKSTDKGQTWEIISPDLTTNDPDKLNQSESGGLTMDATGAENYCSILVIEPSKIEEDLIWVGTDDGQVHLTKNRGNNWINLTSNIKGLPDGSWITQIKASNKNKGEALLVANDYRRFNYEAYAFKTINYGKTWKRILSNKDVKSYALCIVEDNIEANLIFLGTDDGLYISIDAGDNWTKWTNGFPTVPVKDLIIHPRESDLVIGTFGRAAWIIDNIEPLRAIAKNNKVLLDTIKLFSPPTAYKAAFQQPTGSRFGGDALYHGTNRPRGAKLSFYFNANNKLENDSITNWDSLYMKIYDNKKLIRTLKKKAPKESGINYFYWYMDEKGIQWPSKKIKESNYEPYGVKVPPGKFKLILEYGNLKSEQFIQVKNDPRIELDSEKEKEIYKNLKLLESYQKITSRITHQLAQSKEIAVNHQDLLKKFNNDEYKENSQLTEKTINEIEILFELIFGKEDKRQGITAEPTSTLLVRLREAQQYVSSRQNGITQTEKTLIKQLKKDLKNVIVKVNNFFDEDWMKFKSSLETVNLSPFKKIETFELLE